MNNIHGSSYCECHKVNDSLIVWVIAEIIMFIQINVPNEVFRDYVELFLICTLIIVLSRTNTVN